MLFQLQENCFLMLSWLYSIVNHPYAYLQPLLLKPASHPPPTPLGHHRVPQAEFPVLHSSFSLASYFTQGAASIPSMHYTFSFLLCVHQPVIQSKSERGKQILYVQARKMVLMKLFAGKEKRCCCREWHYPFLRSRFLL